MVNELTDILKGEPAGMRVDPDFTLMVQSASIEEVKKALKDYNVAVDSMIRGIYTDHMGMSYNSCMSTAALTSKKGFDRMSYAIFAAYLIQRGKSDSRISVQEKEMTTRIGDIIYTNIKTERDISVEGHMSQLSYALEEICRYFEEKGYYSSAEVIMDDPRAEFCIHDLEQGKSTGIIYRMEDPVILASAQDLNRKYGSSCQHFSSRTIQACLRQFNLTGMEVKFNPNDHTSEGVLEKWEIYNDQ
ncbi:MAG: hypothetical protein R6U32_05680 [Candidatus Woesearchaeota archaeon]